MSRAVISPARVGVPASDDPQGQLGGGGWVGRRRGCRLRPAAGRDQGLGSTGRAVGGSESGAVSMMLSDLLGPHPCAAASALAAGEWRTRTRRLPRLRPPESPSHVRRTRPGRLASASRLGRGNSPTCGRAGLVGARLTSSTGTVTDCRKPARSEPQPAGVLHPDLRPRLRGRRASSTRRRSRPRSRLELLVAEKIRRAASTVVVVRVSLAGVDAAEYSGRGCSIAAAIGRVRACCCHAGLCCSLALTFGGGTRRPGDAEKTVNGGRLAECPMRS